MCFELRILSQSPLSIFVSDEVKTGVYRNLFHPDQLLSGIMDGANNFARGSFAVASKHLSNLSQRIRKSLEECDRPQGFLLNHSLSGGTGSGFTSSLLHHLKGDYSKYALVQLPIFPGPNLPSSITEPYNTTFHVHSTLPVTDLVFLFDNDAMYEICYKHLFIQSPTFTNINRIVALINSSVTSSLRFDGVINANLTNILTNLIPFPRIHFPVVSHVPIMHASRASHITMTTKVMLKNMFTEDFQFMKCNLNSGQYLAILLNGRGLISPVELNEAIHQLKLSQTVKFVDWSPRGFKLCLNNQIPTIVPDSEIAFSERALTMISNSTAIKDCWIPLGYRFDLLFEKRAFIHWFVEEGMEETDFLDARSDLLSLNLDYQQMMYPKSEVGIDMPIMKMSSKPSLSKQFYTD